MTERVLSLFWSRQTALSVFFFVFVQHSQSPPQKKSGFKRIRIYYFSSFFFLLFLKQGLTVSSRLALNSLCCPGWPQTGNAPTPTSCMPGLQLCAIMSGRVNCFFMGLTLLTDSLTQRALLGQYESALKGVHIPNVILALQPSSHKYCVSSACWS